MNVVRNILLWCSGTDRTKIASIPERARYVGFGSAVLLTSAVAFISMSVALTYVFNARPAVYVPVALVWAAIVFTFDRLITSYVSDERGVRRLVTSLPRIAVAIFLGIVISEPLILRVYEREIVAQIVVEQQQAEKAMGNAVRRDSPLALERANLERRRTRNDRELAAAETRVARALRAFDVEEDGRGGTRVPGYGPVARRKEQELLAAQEARAAVKRRVTADNARVDRALADVERRTKTEINGRRDSIHESAGLLARERALDSLIKRDPELATRRWFLVLVVLMVDLLPTLLKLMWPPSEHDRQITSEARARGAARDADEEVGQVAFQHRARAAKDISEARMAAARDVEIHLIEVVKKAQIALISHRVAQWEGKIRDQIDAGQTDIDLTPPEIDIPAPPASGAGAPRVVGVREPAAAGAPHPVDVRSPGRRGIRPRIAVIIRKFTVKVGLPRPLHVVTAITLALSLQSADRPARFLLAHGRVEPASSSTLPVTGIAKIDVPRDGVSGTGTLVVTQEGDRRLTADVTSLNIDLVGARLTRPVTLEVTVPNAVAGSAPTMFVRAGRRGSWTVQRAHWNSSRRRLTTQVAELGVEVLVQP